jgi:hypothetical protein
MTNAPARIVPIALLAAAVGTLAPQAAAQSGYGYGAGTGGGGGGTDVNGVPAGVGYNNPGGEISRQALQQAATAPEQHFHMAGPTAYGNATVQHHYGPGYPPPIGTTGDPNDGNASSINASGSVAGNPGLVNWGTTPAWTREEMGNGVWFAGAGGQASSSPVPWVGSFND